MKTVRERWGAVGNGGFSCYMQLIIVQPILDVCHRRHLDVQVAPMASTNLARVRHCDGALSNLLPGGQDVPPLRGELHVLLECHHVPRVYERPVLDPHALVRRGALAWLGVENQARSAHMATTSSVTP